MVLNAVKIQHLRFISNPRYALLYQIHLVVLFHYKMFHCTKNLRAIADCSLHPSPKIDAAVTMARRMFDFFQTLFFKRLSYQMCYPFYHTF